MAGADIYMTETGTNLSEEEYLNYDGPVNQNQDAYPPSIEEELAGAQPEAPAAEEPQTSEAEVQALREQLYQERQAQMQNVEREHQRKLQELNAATQLAQAQLRAQQQAQESEMSEFDKAVNAAVNQKLAQTVAPEMQRIRSEMQVQAATQAVHSVLNAGKSNTEMPEFDRVSGIAISRFGKDVVMQRIMNSAPHDAARWLYDLGVAELTRMTGGVQPQQLPQQTQAPAAPQHRPAPQMPRGMQVQGGSPGMSGSDWAEIDKRIDSMDRFEISEFVKNPKNKVLFERMLMYGTTNPNPPRIEGR